MPRLWIAALVALLVALAPSAYAQDASDFFHGGAQHFIGESLDDAAKTVAEGLAQHPDDAQLQELQRLIQEAQEQQQQNQGQENEDQQSGNEDQENEQGGNQGQQDEEQQQDDSQSEEQENEEQSDEEQEPQEQDGQDQEGGEQPEEQPSDGSEGASEVPIDPNRLTEEEAERILQALANEEEQLLREVQKIKGRARRVEKDW